ncbi:ribonuclease Z [Halalkalibacter wakoensis JCM 9140]|uniref:Ribonuclease Z n=1 Tax=Halalkalibacter wakoensis JCM 9140 TaxID=1236970 RepID=W4PZ58_9BACI|nr:ribonuclease Z [Halalkalibacter wakoensis]GAE25017.1 ribonuclease Z [Halalkalibacter wakoensis JCM 9140]
MEFHFLGTGSGVPSTTRNVSGLVVRFLQKKSTQWLFDCGEATQHQILQTPITLTKIDRIFISHLHGDHLFGLPGLLCSRSAQGAKTALTVYGPKGVEEFIQSSLTISKSFLSYDIDFVEISEGVIFEDDSIKVEVTELDHVMPSYAFKLIEADQPGSLMVDQLKSLGIEPGPIYQKIKRGERVQLPDGQMIIGTDYVTEKKQGRVVVIAGDTRPMEKMVTFADSAHLLIHEGTFRHDKKEHAEQFGHSTITEVAELAKRANVSQLILTHISSRYAGEEEELSKEVQMIFAHSIIAHDFMVYRLMNNVQLGCAK